MTYACEGQKTKLLQDQCQQVTQIKEPDKTYEVDMTEESQRARKDVNASL